MRHIANYSTAVSMFYVLCSLAFGDDRNKITGCVTDEKGQPVIGIKVHAQRQEGEVSIWHTKTDWKGETQRGTGCFEITKVPQGTYLLALQDPRFGIPGVGPVQATAKVLLGDAARADLTTELPNRKLLHQGLLQATSSATTGFTNLRQFQLTDTNTALQYGGLPGWYVTPRVEGFNTCVIGYNQEGPAAMYWCKLGGIRTAEDARQLFSKFQSAVADSMAHLPALGYQGLDPGPCQDKNCYQQVQWISRSNGLVQLQLRQGMFHQYEISLWLEFSKALLEQAGALAQTSRLQSSSSSDKGAIDSVNAAPRRLSTAGSPAPDSTLSALREIVRAAGGAVPFETIKGQSTAQDRNRWEATIALPGATSCSISLVTSQSVTRPWYSCFWKYQEPSKAQASYDTLVQTVQSSGEWSPRGNFKDAVFHTQSSFGADLSITLQPNTNSVLLMVTYSRTDPAASTGTPHDQAPPTLERWGSGITETTFGLSIRRLVAASQEHDPFESLKGNPDPSGPTFWQPVILLPGAEHCDLNQNPKETILGRWVGKFYWYHCQSAYETPEAARAGQQELLSLISRTTGWPIRTDDAATGAATIENGNATASPCSFKVALESGNKVSVSTYPNYFRRIRNMLTPELTANALHRVLTTAAERVPFGSITAERDPDSQSWFTTDALPGADVCKITVVQNPRRAAYVCYVSSWDNLQPAESYDKLISIIRQTGDWSTSQSAAQDPQSLRVADFQGSLGNAFMHVSLSRQNQVALLMFAAPR